MAACVLLVIVPCPASALEPAAGQASPALHLAVADIDAIGAAALLELKHLPKAHGWIELDDRLLLAAPAAALDAAELLTSIDRLGVLDSKERLYLVQRSHQPPVVPLGARRLLEASGRMVVAGVRNLALEPAPHSVATCRGHAQRSAALAWGTVLMTQQANRVPVKRRAFAPGVQLLVDSVDENRWFGDIQTLAGWNRHTTTGSSEIDLARDWLLQQFSSLPSLSVRSESFSVGGTTAWNVIAELPGRLRPDTWHLVGAHYDATSQSPGTAAPGAEDNASGCAGVLEMARAFTTYQPAETIFFLCYSGEEQGLFGSTDHASGLVASGESSKVESVQIMDMIGYTGDADLDSLLESDGSNLPLLDLYAAAAAEYTDLRIVTSTFPFGSDHVPYLNRGMPALLVIENDWDSYPGYHRTSDLPNNISLAMGGETLRMNAAALADLAGAPSAEAVFSAGFESGDLGEWTTSCNDCDK